MVRIDLWALPSSPIAVRAALMRLLSAESEIARSPQTLSDQFVLADEAVALLDQKKQQIEHLRLQGNPNAVPAQLAELAVKLMIIKAKSQMATSVPLLKQKSAISQAKHNHPQKSYGAQYGILQR